MIRAGIRSAGGYSYTARKAFCALGYHAAGIRSAGTAARILARRGEDRHFLVFIYKIVNCTAQIVSYFIQCIDARISAAPYS